MAAMKHKVKTKSGQAVRLVTDDTYTLALCVEGERTETTPAWLAATFSPRTLLRIAAKYPAHASARTKVDRALGAA